MSIKSRRVAVAVVAAVALTSIAVDLALKYREEQITGSARADSALSSQDIKASVLARCPWRDVDLTKVTLGPMTSTGDGLVVVTATSTELVLSCGLTSTTKGSSTTDVSAVDMNDRVVLGAGGIGDFIGYGRVAPGVVAVEILTPGGQRIDAEVSGEVFLYLAPGLSAEHNLIARARDRDGKVLYEGTF